MTDYVEVTAGTGERVAVDEITGGPADGLKVQRLKAGFGSDNAYADVEPEVGLPVAPATRTATYSATTPDAVLFTEDVTGFRGISVTSSETTDGGWAVRLAVSNDGTTWTSDAVGLWSQVHSTGSRYVQPGDAQYGPLAFRHLRGTLVADAELSAPAEITVEFTTAAPPGPAVTTILLDDSGTSVTPATPLPAAAYNQDGPVTASNPLQAQLYLEPDSAIEPSNPLPVQVYGGLDAQFNGTLVTTSDRLPVTAVLNADGADITAANPLPVATAPANLRIAGADVDGSNAVPVGNAVGPNDLSNPLYVSLSAIPNLTVGGTEVDSGNPVPVTVGGTVPVSGTVGISGTVPVSGTVGVSGTVPVSGTVGVSGTVPVSGTVGVTPDPAGLPTAGGYTELTGGPISAASTDIIASTDVRGYRSAVIQFTGTYSGTALVQGSNNGSTWFTLPLYQLNSSQMKLPLDAAPSSPTSVLWLVNLPTRYVRVRTSSYTSGSLSAICELFAEPVQLQANNGVGIYATHVSTDTPQLVQAANFSGDADTFSSVGSALLTTALPRLYNGASWDRQRTASGAHGTSGAGLAGAGQLAFDGTNWRRVRSGVATSAVTSVAAAVTTTSLLASNTSREAGIFYNDSASAYLYLKLGATASLTSFTVRLSPGGYFELPKPVWTGAIDGIWDVASGSARITELS